VASRLHRPIIVRTERRRILRSIGAVGELVEQFGRQGVAGLTPAVGPS
jgi:hypothetical protein